MLAMILGFWGCANMGAPEGGPFDVTPPRLIKALPEQGSRQVSETKMILRFDEFIKLAGQQDKVIVSPPQHSPAKISASGKTVYIQLEDSLKPNTTYSFYFDDAIVDNNEDNPLENFGYSFSTGDTLDSMQLLGSVLDARTLEPVQDVLLGIYWASQLSDTLMRTSPFPFVSKTNKLGEFVVRGLRDSAYLICALKDDNNDFLYSQPNEGLAFDLTTYRTSLVDSMRTDTIRIDSIVRRDTLHRDSLVTYPYTYYYPRDLMLRYFVAEQKRMGLERYERIDSLRYQLEFASELDSLPELYLIDTPKRPSTSLYRATLVGDRTVQYWLRDSLLISADSIRLGIKYSKTDSLLRPSLTTDTITLYKPREKARSSSKSDQNKDAFTLSFATGKGVKSKTPGDSLFLVSTHPLEAFADSVIKVESTSDSIYAPTPFVIKPIPMDALRYHIALELMHGVKYRLSIDSAQIHNIYGEPHGKLSFEHKISNEEELGGLQVSLEDIDLGAGEIIAELLDKSDKVLATTRAMRLDSLPAEGQTPVGDSVVHRVLSPRATTTDSLKPSSKQEHLGSTADSLNSATDSITRATQNKPLAITFKDLPPGEYYLRLYIDANADSMWTTGSYPDRQPEQVYYCPQLFAIKKGFTSSEVWAPRALPLDKQKPEALRKIKPEPKKKREDKNIEYYKRLKEKKGKQSGDSGAGSLAMPTGIMPGGF